MEMIGISSLWVFGALLGYVAADRRGFSVPMGILGGFLLGPLAFLLFFVRSRQRRCPSCAEFVKKEATVCKHCQQTLTPEIPWQPRSDRLVTINDWLNVAIVLMTVAVVLAFATRWL